MNEPNIFVISAVLNPSWGYSIREINTTASQPPVLLPPPTTVVGSISNALAKIYNIPEQYLNQENKYTNLAEELYNATLYAGATIIGAGVIHNDINRYLMRTFSRKTNRVKPEYQFAAVSVGKVYLRGNIKILIAFDLDKLMKLNTIKKYTSIIEKDLEKASYYLTRLGSKESIVSVSEVKTGNPKRVGNIICTSLYQSEKSVSINDITDCENKRKIINYFLIRFWKSGFSKIGEPELYLVPGRNDEFIINEKLRFKLNENCIGYEFDGEGFSVCQ
jgi:CRISPR-associated protein Cas5 subtype I-A